jgi:hypothetical protein
VGVKKVEFSGEVPRGVEAVYGALTSPEFWSSYAQDNSLAPPRFTRSEEGGGSVTTMASTVSVSDARAKSFVGDSADVTATTRWDPGPAPYRGDLRVDVAARQKADVAGTVRLEASGPTSTRLSFAGQLNVRIPFVGGAVEGQAVKYVPQGFANLAAKLTSWLPAGS